MHLIVVHSPEAGAGGWRQERVAQLLHDAGHTFRMVSWRKKNWPDDLGEEADAIVAAGGDGTVHKVIKALEGRDLPVAILPLGTANNVAHSLGFTTGDDLAARVAGWKDRERMLCLARVEKDNQRQSFLESVGIGAFATMIRHSRQNGRKSLPAIALLAIRLRLVEKMLQARPLQITASIDGTPVAGEFVLLECLNLPYYGPRLRLAPEQSPESPTITVCGVTVEAREAAAQWISTGEGDVGNLFLGRGRSIEIEADHRAHVDGILWPKKVTRDGHLRIRAAASTMRVWV